MLCRFDISVQHPAVVFRQLGYIFRAVKEFHKRSRIEDHLDIRGLALFVYELYPLLHKAVLLLALPYRILQLALCFLYLGLLVRKLLIQHLDVIVYDRKILIKLDYICLKLTFGTLQIRDQLLNIGQSLFKDRLALLGVLLLFLALFDNVVRQLIRAYAKR